MRNRIEAKHDIAGEPSFARPTSRELLKADRIPSLRHADAPVRTVVDEKAGGLKAKLVQERTATPLKIVFITCVDSTSEEIGASACRRLSKSLTARGHRLLLLERGQKPKHGPPAGGQTVFYDSVKDLKDRFAREIRNADFVMISSNVSDGAAIGDWVTHIAQGTTAFYDLNTPVTLRKLDRGESEHLSRALIQRYQLYLSFTGGPLLELIKRYYGSPLVRPLYGSVDTSVYYPEKAQLKWDLGYVGNRDEERSPGVDELLLEPARNWPGGQFVLAGHGFSQTSDWPANVKRLADIAFQKDRAFYNAQRFALNVTGPEMIDAGFSPSPRIFEAAACGTPIISDYWEDLESFFAPDEEILFARSAEEVLDYLRGIGEDERLRIGDNARHRIIADHSVERRVLDLESYAMEALARA